MCPKDVIQNNDQIDVKKTPDEEVNDVDFHRYDEQVIKLKTSLGTAHYRI